jgi:uncharacterized membrane-anchored protein YitT (DUF2179 family)
LSISWNEFDTFYLNNMKNIREKVQKEIRPFVFSTLGMAILALTINVFSWRYRLVSGGFPGFGLVVNYLTDIPLGAFLLVSNTIILLSAFLIAGKIVGIRGIYGYVFFSLFIEFSREILGFEQVSIDAFSTNLILSILQGVFGPLGVSLVVASDYSLGNYTSIFPIVKKYINISAPLLFFILDVVLTIVTLVYFGVEMGILLFVNAIVFFVCFKYELRVVEKLVNNCSNS